MRRCRTLCLHTTSPFYTPVRIFPPLFLPSPPCYSPCFLHLCPSPEHPGISFAQSHEPSPAWDRNLYLSFCFPAALPFHVPPSDLTRGVKDTSQHQINIYFDIYGFFLRKVPSPTISRTCCSNAGKENNVSENKFTFLDQLKTLLSPTSNLDSQ